MEQFLNFHRVRTGIKCNVYLAYSSGVILSQGCQGSNLKMNKLGQQISKDFSSNKIMNFTTARSMYYSGKT